VDEPAKAMGYLKSSSGQQLLIYLNQFGMSSVCDQVYGYVFAELGQFDSARLYFTKALPFFEKSSNESNTLGFYRQLAGFYKKTGETKKSMDYFLKVKEIGERKGILEAVRAAAKNLDTLYEQNGDFKTAAVYNAMYYQYKDSIEKINKQNELLQIAALDEQQRIERKIAEEAEAKEKRNRIQYMAIVIGIAALFVGLVMMGWFKVSASTIKAIGFFAFLLFFEFIFLVFKKNIYGITKGEPMYDLLFMIALAAILVPLHHWLEHKVIHFLTSHHMLKLKNVFSRSRTED
jgi:tetratricopeptide (TPR) repeat protein